MRRVSFCAALALSLLPACAAHRTGTLAPASESAPVQTAPADCPPPTQGTVDFQTQVLPLMMKRCAPCHFPGGKMYERLPFDREHTIRELGARLFTRIEREDEQALLLRFFAQKSEAAGVEAKTAPPPWSSTATAPCL